ncbi:MAG: methylated-DNA--[protein]-cysteine S-methyltransferase [Betaproteobacteria bacterium]|nr:methylated-DNA--[protein]-cysteine S-methyltransferase [Betaproteobacteria bacterium]
MLQAGPELIADSERPGARTRDYERVARAIEYLRRHAANQPDLAAVASHVHLSEYHFQRLFTRWAGVSPKRFLQFLTVEHAKTRIAAARSALDLATDVGLSGPGRLHDLFVRLEAMSPGEFKSGGAGLRIGFGTYESPFGPCLIASTARGICALRFLERATEREAAAILGKEWPQAGLELDEKAARLLGERVFDPLRSPDKPLALLVRGTNFQVQVWRALVSLPFGALTTYRDLAARIGRSSAARAVGTAVGANPIAWLIPCHRVIRESGELGGYRWGIERKAAILGWEAARVDNARG